MHPVSCATVCTVDMEQIFGHWGGQETDLRPTQTCMIELFCENI